MARLRGGRRATACSLTSTPLGAMPVRTFLHAAVYQLAVVALDLEALLPRRRLLDELLALGLVALVDSTGCLAARRGLDASLVADARTDAAATTRRGGVWGFGAARRRLVRGRSSRSPRGRPSPRRHGSSSTSPQAVRRTSPAS